jgi:predicted O-linked N-acetylglucosamine transferase (SPINDLY family)
LCITVTKEFPKHPFAWKVLAVVLKLTGRLNESLIPSQKSVQLEPRDADAHNNLGIILQELNRLDEAEASLKKALTLRPEYAEAHYNLGITLKEQGKLIESEASYKQAIKLKPNYSEALTNLGATLQELNRLDEAEASLKKALTLKPNYVQAHNNLGITLKEQGKLIESEASYKQAIKLKPNYAEAHYNLGITLKEQGKLIESEASYKQAIKLKPNYVQAHNNLGGVLKQRGRLEEAIISYNKAIELEPRYVEAHSNRNLCLNYLSSYSPLFIYKQHLEFEKQFGGLKVELPTILSFMKNTNYRLRIGYVSADFKEHSVAFFFEPLLKNHCSNVVETFCYYNDRVIDTTTKRLMATCDHWRSIYGLTDQNVVNLIRNDKIDILVDLSGHTAGNRLLVFVQKPSPVQVTWLGYPNTTGLSSVDYRFTDIISDPVGDVDNLYSETLIRLPNGFLCYQGNKNILVDNVLPQSRHEQITFGSFNNVSKITPIVIKTWSKILHAVPTSRLILKLPTLDTDTNKYHELFIKEGISKERIEFYQRSPSFEEHLNLYNIIDICLDPFPYNGATTTCEALWMGVPVITLLGNCHVGRVGASILTNIGLTDFIANDINNYIKLAVDMSNNTKYLKEIRRNLREQMQKAPLCNAPSFASDVERAYQNIWYKYHQKQT